MNTTVATAKAANAKVVVIGAGIGGSYFFIVIVTGGSAGIGLETTRASLTVTRFSSAADFREYFKSHYGPTIAVYRSIADDPDRVAALDCDLDALVVRSRQDAGALMAWEYLLFTGTRA